MKTEQWRDIPNYEGHYKVSDLGRLKSIKDKSKIIKPILSKNGYLKKQLCKEGVVKMYSIHSLVAITFLNHTPNGHKLVVDHINNDKMDNRLENLQIITHRENSSKDKIKVTSKYTGVSWCKNREKWISCIYVNNKSKFLGRYKNEIDAHNAYQKALLSLTTQPQ